MFEAGSTTPFPGIELCLKSFDALPAHIAVVDARGTILLVNRAWREFGDANGAADSPEIAVGANYLDVCRKSSSQDELAQQAFLGIKGVLEGVSTDFSLEYPCPSPGEDRWFVMQVAPLERGQHVGTIISHTCITARVVAEAAQRATDARCRAIFSSAPVGIAELDATGRWLRINHKIEKILGYSEKDLLGQRADELTIDDQHQETEIANFALLRSGGTSSFVLEKRMRCKNASSIWVTETVDCVRRDDGSIESFIVALEDISQRRSAEDRQQTLIHELSHRGKNLLAVIQSIANRTFSGVQTMEAARRAFEGRLDALAKTYSSLTDESFEGAPLQVVLDNELNAFADRVSCEGPNFILTVKAAQTFSLVLHELATNASKYGSLSHAGGRLLVKWEVVGKDRERFRFEWREEGGVCAEAPTGKGFGSYLLERVAASEFQCKPQIDCGASGLRYSFEAPTKRLGALKSDTQIREKLRSNTVRALYDEWLRLKYSADSLPSLANFDLQRFVATGALTIATVNCESSVCFVQIGRALTEELGKPTSDRDLTQEERDGLADAYRRCAQSGVPCHEYLCFDFGDDSPLSFERLLVPFDPAPNTDVRHVVGIIVFGGSTREPDN